MNGCFRKRTVSLEDIANEFNLEPTNPLPYGLCIHQGIKNLEYEEKEIQKIIYNKLMNKQKKLNKINLEYMERHK
jgi:hypothetical protein